MSDDDSQDHRAHEDHSEGGESSLEETNGGTTTVQFRWKYLSSVITLFVTASYTALVLAQSLGYTETTINGGTWATFSLAFIACIAYSVGVDTLKAAVEARDG